MSDPVAAAPDPALEEDATAPDEVADASVTALLEEFAPACVVVDESGAVRFLHGPVRDYLDFPEGDPHLTLPDIALHGLRAKLRTALAQARQLARPVSSVAKRVRREGRVVSVRLRVRALAGAVRSRLWMVTFVDEPDPARPDDASGDKDRARELAATRENLQRTIEALERANKERITVNAQLQEKVFDLKEMTDDLTNFLASTDVATIFLDSELRIRRFTPARARLMSFCDSDVGRPLRDLTPTVDDPDLMGDARRVLAELTPVEREVRAEGGADYIRRITPFRTATDQIGGVIVTYSDVSRLKEAGRRLEGRERQQAVTARLGRMALAGRELSDLFDDTVSAIAETMQLEYVKILRLERSGRELRLVAGVGWREGLVGRATEPTGIDSPAGYTLETGGPVITPDLRKEKRFSPAKLLVDHGVVSGMTVVIGPEDAPWGVLGAYTTKEMEFTVDDTNFILAIANVIWQAVRRRATEARLRERLAEIAGIYDTAPIGLCFIDRELRYVRLNERLAEMDGKTVDEHIGRTVREVVPQLADRVEPLLQGVIDTGEAALHVEIRGAGSTEDDGQRSWLASCSPLLSNGEVVGVNIAVLDITERRRVEQDLEVARAAAEAANEAKTHFLANMSHEIRSPLTAILGFAEVLDSRLDSVKDRSLVNTIKQNGDHLCQIVDDILDLAKIESGTLRLRRTRCELGPIFAYVRSLMGARAGKKNLTLQIEFQGELPPAIQSDPRMLRQILLNLIGNAIKFTFEGGVRVVVCLERGEEDRLRIDVIDSGLGIDRVRWESIFAPFEQIDSSPTRESGGTGLGLAITKRLVEALGGSIEVDSTVGAGTTFTVRLGVGRVAQADLTTIDSTALPEQESGIVLHQLPKLSGRILAVEDRSDIQLLVREFLESVGCEVLTASDGAEAIAIWQASRRGSRPLDAVLMDIQMPLMDGMEATRKLREEGFEGPIIALTAGVMETDREKCLEAGFDDFIGKPIDPVALVHTIAGWMEASDRDDESTADDHALGILFVEDHRDVASVQKLMLEARGHRVTIALNGKQALSALEHFTPDVVMLDLGLPGMSGSELIGHLRRRPELGDCLFVCISGREAQDVEWRRMGFHHFLRKPARIEDLDQVLASGRGH